MNSGAKTQLKPGQPHLVLLDGSTYIFRAFHALPPLTRKSDGLPVGAVAGFSNMLWRLLREQMLSSAPSHLAVVFDARGKTFRSEIYPDYKAHRPDPPEELIPQFDLVRHASDAFNLARIEQEGIEADDIIATLATKAAQEGAFVEILSSDKDLMQLVGQNIRLFDPMKQRPIGIEEVRDKFGVSPDKVVDVQSLAGDSVDNVPGVPGIGIKTAAELINLYGDLETLLERAGEIKQNKRRETLISNAEMARISRKLVKLQCDAELALSWNELAVAPIDGDKLISFCKAMEFNSLTNRVATALDLNIEAVEADPHLKVGSKEHSVAQSFRAANAAPDESQTAKSSQETGAQANASRILSRMGQLPVNREHYATIQTVELLQAFLAEAMDTGRLAIDTETTGLDPLKAQIVGISIATAPGRAGYIPLAHQSDKGLFGDETHIQQLPVETVCRWLAPVLADASVLKIGQNLKYDLHVLSGIGLEVKCFDDTMLMSYVLESGNGGHGMDALANRWLGHETISFNQVTEGQKSPRNFAFVPIEKATAYAAEDADITLRLHHVLKAQLIARGMLTQYETLERPLIGVLKKMECRGIEVDRLELQRLSSEFGLAMADLEQKIHDLAGQVFNIGSPKQLGEILFERLKLQGGKKTRTGAWSTDADVLEQLAAQGHPLPSLTLQWRLLQKLRSTYTEALQSHILPATERIHTSFAMASTTTGRLSSLDPNLQNIPIRTEEGRKIRKCFKANTDKVLISADYSQIELRVLAHVADIKALKEAFKEDKDIHAMTASEVFGVPLEGMDPIIRRQAKAINFGIIYGISAFGLAAQLGIGQKEARLYIEKYFERFPGIRHYMEHTRQEAHSRGYVETIFGRRAHFPNIGKAKAAEKAFLERAAINAPIQGSAADIIRRAMIKLDALITQKEMNLSMLLQVHDELVFEAPVDQAEEMMPIIRSVMESACLPALDFSVPLKVDVRAAGNWDDAH